MTSQDCRAHSVRRRRSRRCESSRRQQTGLSDRRARAGRERECASLSSSLWWYVVLDVKATNNVLGPASICQGSLVLWPVMTGACALARPRRPTLEKYATTLIPNPLCRPVSSPEYYVPSSPEYHVTWAHSTVLRKALRVRLKANQQSYPP